jgi:ornithine carbamoyltransferase
MAFNLRNRSYVKELDFTPDELRFLLKLSAELKAAKYGGYEQPLPVGQEHRPDLREDLDPHPHRLRGRRPRPGRARHLPRAVGLADRPQGVDEGHGRVLGRTFDGIEYRGFARQTVETSAEHAGVPVWNGLTDEFHPTQTWPTCSR